MLCHSVFSVFSPEALSVHPSSVAMEKRQNGVPLAVYFISGSRPSRPTRITLLIDFPITVFLQACCPCYLGGSFFTSAAAFAASWVLGHCFPTSVSAALAWAVCFSSTRAWPFL